MVGIFECTKKKENVKDISNFSIKCLEIVMTMSVIYVASIKNVIKIITFSIL